MEFYTYVSDAKVEMMLAQLPAPKRRLLAKELQIDTKILSVKLTREAAPTDDESRFRRVAAVAKHVAVNEWCAPLDHEAPYILDTLPLHWGRLRRLVEDMEGTRVLQHELESPVLFGLGREAREFNGVDLIMTGSASHLVGESVPAGVTVERRGSLLPWFTWFLENRYEGPRDEADDETVRLGLSTSPGAGGEEVPGLPDDVVATVAAAGNRESLPPRAIDHAVVEQLERSRQASKWMWRLDRLRADVAKLPVQRVKFLAKRLSKFGVARVGYGSDRRGPGHFAVGTPVILASPVYVAIAE